MECESLKTEIYLKEKQPPKPKEDTEYIAVDANYYALCRAITEMTIELRKMRNGG